MSESTLQTTRNIISEYTDNICEGATQHGDFFIVTLPGRYLNELTNKLLKHDCTCSHAEPSRTGEHVTVRYDLKQKLQDS